MLDERERKIRAKAYELWESAGRPGGREKEHWAEAERLVDADEAQASSVKPRAPRRNKANAGEAAQTKLKPSRKLATNPKRPIS